MFINIRQITFVLLGYFCFLAYCYPQNNVRDNSDIFQRFQSLGSVEEKIDYFFESKDNRYRDTSAYRWLGEVNELLEESEATNDSLAIIQYKTMLSQIYYETGYFQKGIGLTEDIYKTKLELSPKTRLYLLEVMDNTYAALKRFDKQLVIRQEIRKLGRDVSLYDIYANLGLYNTAVKYYIMRFESTIDESDFLENAKYNFQRAEYHRLDGSIYMSIKRSDIALSYINLYLSENRYDKTEEQLKSALLIKGKIQGNLGKCKVALKQYNEAVPLLEAAVNLIAEKYRGAYSDELMELWAHLADCYLELNNIPTAKAYLDSIVSYEKDLRVTGFNRLLAEYYLKIQEADSASYYFKKYIEVKDSAYALKTKQKLLGTLVTFDLENQKATIEKQKKDIESTKEEILQRDKRINYSMVALFLALIISVAAIYGYFRSVKNKRVIEEQKSIIESSLAEKDSLLKEIHHRVKNNLQMVSSLLSMQTKNTRSKEAIAALEEGRSRVKAMALIHQKLYQNEDLSVISMQEYIESLVNSVQSVYKKGGHKINIIIDAEGTELDIDRAIPIGLIINELVSNSLKYAFVGREDGQIYISVRMNGKLGIFEYLDNGNGLPDDVEKRAGSSLGIKLIERLVNQLRSTLNFDKDVDGVRFWFNFS